MTTMSFIGDFPQVGLALIFSLGCALLIAFISLQILIRLITREQYNVTDAPRRVRAIVWMGRRDGSRGPIDPGGGHATGGAYQLPAAAARNRFTRTAKPDAADAGQFVHLPERSGAGIAKVGPSDHGHAA